MKKKILIFCLSTLCTIITCAGCAKEAGNKENVTEDTNESVTENVTETPDEGGFDLDASEPLKVTGGLISGTTSEDGEVAIYKGIPYAAAPVGELRWKAPQPVNEWRGVLSCTDFAPCEYQNVTEVENIDLEAMPWMKPYTQEFVVNSKTDAASEDCLYLNVWTKNGTSQEDKPVIVYIHGGGYGEGSGSIKAYDGEGIAKKDAVYVSINYRFGIFGFLTTPELDAESENGTSGNYGLMDTVAALEWVKNNISQFGGNPDNVTIVGQSAGGMSVGFMVQSPLADGLFQNAVILSGNYIRPGRSSAITTKESIQQDFINNYPDVTISDLRNMTSEEIWENYKLSGNVCVDGYVIPADTTEDMANGNHNSVNALISVVEGDIFSFMEEVTIESIEELETWVNENCGEYAQQVMKLYKPENDQEAADAYYDICVDRQLIANEIYAEFINKSGKNAYLAYYTHTIPGEYDCGAFHTSDVPYWLDNPVREEYWEDIDSEISDTMSDYLVNFAKNANPNEDEELWGKYDGSCKYMKIGDNTYEMEAVSEEKENLWKEYHSSVSLNNML